MAIMTEQIRNIALLGHGGTGKTAVNEAILYLTKNIDRLGNTPAGNTVSDFDPEEIKRGFSISASVSNVMWNDKKINIVDTPGFLGFAGEVVSALRVCGNAIIVIDGKAGVEVGTELAWERSTDAGVPKAFFINKYDDPDAHFHRIMRELRDTFGAAVCPVTVPVNNEKGVIVDVVNQKKYTYNDKGIATVTDASAEDVENYRPELLEAVAAVDEELMEKFFAEEPITTEEILKALRQGLLDGSIAPVFCGSAAKLWGIDVMLNIVADSFPSPVSKIYERQLVDGEPQKVKINEDGETAVLVFKTSIDQFGRTTYFKVMNGKLTSGQTLVNAQTASVEKFAHIYTLVGKKQTEVEELCCGDIGVVTKLANTNTCETLSKYGTMQFQPPVYPAPYYSMAVVSTGKGDEDKIAQGIYKMLDEDKTLRLVNDAETKQLVLSGLGDMQLDVVISRLKARTGVSALLVEPKIAYRETIKKKVSVEGKHKKQSGGHGQYGHVKITFSPGTEDGLTFTTSVVGGSVPKGYFPAVEKGLLEAMQKGVLAGYPVVGLAADLFDGSYHDVDSNELSFKMAASLAYKAGLPQAGPVLLEPIGILKVTVPEALVGDVMGDINGKRRGSVLSMDFSATRKGYTTIEAEVPKSEMSDYTIVLRALSQGKGSYSYEFTRYDEVPMQIAQKIIAEAKANASDDE
ncbi:MAG: elongation factor G [Ruminococcaceae bacterium]|nr:elongation factor G [Oscillospiraceae bacterium]